MRRLPILFLVLAGCGGGERVHLATPIVDTLPNGARSVENPGPTAWDDPAAVVFTETLRLGEDADPGSLAELIDPQSVAFDGAGRIYVTDTKPAVVKVYDRHGTFIRTIGHEGRGPGEFLVGYLAVSGSHLYLHDPQVSRTSVFDTSGAFVQSWVSACCYWTNIATDADGNAIIPSPAWDLPGEKLQQLYVRFSSSGDLVDSLKVPERPLPDIPSWNFKDDKGKLRMSMSIPLQPSYEVTPTAAGILMGWSAEYRLLLSNTGRDTALVFGRDWSAPPLDDTRRERVLAEAKEGAFGNLDDASKNDVMKLSDIPSTPPAYLGMTRDGAGRFWVQLDPGSDTTAAAFDVFDGDGIYLGPAKAPLALKRLYRTVWGDGVVYAWGEADDGMPVVYRYEFRLPDET